MSLQENRSRFGLLLLVGVLSALLGYRFFSFQEAKETLSASIDRIEHHVSTPVDPDAPLLDDDTLPPILAPGAESIEPADLVLNGLSYYELAEIDRFFVEKIRERGSAFSIHPPRNLYGVPVSDGIKLTWSRNPLNDETIQKLARNPLLRLHYKIYRWLKGGQPKVVAVTPSGQEEFLDTGVGPARQEYYYCVLFALESTTITNKIITASEKSDVISVVSSDRFSIRVTGSQGDSVFLSVTITERLMSYTESFQVRVGGMIGGPREIPGLGTLDFTTGLTLKEIVREEKAHSVTVRVPDFNSDGSVKIDSSTLEPVFRESTEIQPVQVISIDCEDQNGRNRKFKES